MLTNREMEILQLIVAEHTTEEIAQNLQISTPTVESHRRNMFRKVGVQSAIGLLKEAVKRRWISLVDNDYPAVLNQEK